MKTPPTLNKNGKPRKPGSGRPRKNHTAHTLKCKPLVWDKLLSLRRPREGAGDVVARLLERKCRLSSKGGVK